MVAGALTGLSPPRLLTFFICSLVIFVFEGLGTELVARLAVEKDPAVCDACFKVTFEERDAVKDVKDVKDGEGREGRERRKGCGAHDSRGNPRADKRSWPPWRP